MFTTFRGGQSGPWRITLNSAVKGDGLPAVPALSITQATSIALPLLWSATSWRLAGVTSHAHYVEKAEKAQLAEKQPPLGRKEATSAALIPIRKSAAWWELCQDERREIFEAKSHHIESTLKYLPQVARQIFRSGIERRVIAIHADRSAARKCRLHLALQFRRDCPVLLARNVETRHPPPALVAHI